MSSNPSNPSGTVVHLPSAGSVTVPEFKRVIKYTTFAAEYALRGDDIVMHFYLPAELLRGAITDEAASRASLALQVPAIYSYWLQRFAAVLDPVARNYFEADAPRLQAQYTPELGSWWLKAQGYGHLLNLDAFVDGFLQKMDEALDSLLPSAV